MKEGNSIHQLGKDAIPSGVVMQAKNSLILLQERFPLRIEDYVNLGRSIKVLTSYAGEWEEGGNQRRVFHVPLAGRILYKFQYNSMQDTVQIVKYYKQGGSNNLLSQITLPTEDRFLYLDEDIQKQKLRSFNSQTGRFNDLLDDTDSEGEIRQVIDVLVATIHDPTPISEEIRKSIEE